MSTQSKSESLADLHYALGRAVEDRPGVLLRIDSGAPHDTSERCFEGLGVNSIVRQSHVLENLIQDARRSDPEFDARCQAEWDAIDVDALLVAQRKKRAALKKEQSQ